MNQFEFLLQTGPAASTTAAAPAASAAPVAGTTATTATATDVPQASQGGASLGFLAQLLPILLLIVVFYFLLIRPQNKKQKAQDALIKGAKKGDRIVTIGGVHGTIVDDDGDGTVIVKVDENTKLKFSRSAIATVKSDGPAKKTEDKSDKTEK